MLRAASDRDLSFAHNPKDVRNCEVEHILQCIMTILPKLDTTYPALIFKAGRVLSIMELWVLLEPLVGWECQFMQSSRTATRPWPVLGISLRPSFGKAGLAIVKRS